MNFEEEQEAVEQISSRLQYVRKNIVEEEAALKKAQRRSKRTLEAQQILQHLAQAVQQKAHQQISEVVSSCLSAVFEHPYTFQIQFERKRGKTEANLRFVRDGLDVDPMTSCGGGMIDVAAFALRVACLVMHRPRLSKIIVLDEPFKFVSAQYQSNVRAMLEGLARDMKLQIIMVTHIEELQTGKVIEL